METEVERLVVNFVGDTSDVAQSASWAADMLAEAEEALDKQNEALEETEEAADKATNGYTKLRKGVSSFGDSVAMIPGPVGRLANSMQQASTFVTNLGGGMAKLGPIAIPAAAAVGALTGALAAAAIVYKTVSAAVDLALDKFAELDPIIKQATAVNENVASIQSLGFALGELAGYSIEQTVGALRFMNTQIGLAGIGAGEAKIALEQLGIAVADMARLTPTEQFHKVAEAIKGIDNAAERAAIASKIFGDSGAQLLPALEAQADAIREAEAAAESFGLTLTQGQAKAIENAGDAVNRLKSNVEGLGVQFSAALAPAIEASSEAFEKWLVNAGDSRQQIQMIADMVAVLPLTFAESAIKLGDWIPGLGLVTNQLKEQLTELRGEFEKSIVDRRAEAEAAKEVVQASNDIADAQKEANQAAEQQVEALRRQAEYMAYVEQGGKASQQLFEMMAGQASQEMIDAAAEFEQRIAEIQERESSRKRGQSITEGYKTDIEKAIEQTEELRELLAAGDISQTTYDRAIKDINDGLNEAEETAKDLKSIFDPLGDSYIEGMEGFEESLKKARGEGFQVAVGGNQAEAEQDLQRWQFGGETNETDKKLVDVLELLQQKLSEGEDPDAMALVTTGGNLF